MGMGGYGGGGIYGQPGMMGNEDPNDPNSLTNTFSQSTQATFQIIESLVGAFGGFAQMLESTYMATHSSFFGLFPPFPRFYMASTRGLLLRVDAGRLLTVGSYSNGPSGRTILYAPHDPRFHTRHLHPPPLAPYPLRQSHRSPSTRGRHITHSLSVCIVPRALLPRALSVTKWPANTLKETVSNIPSRRDRIAISHDETNSKSCETE